MDNVDCVVEAAANDKGKEQDHQGQEQDQQGKEQRLTRRRTTPNKQNEQPYELRSFEENNTPSENPIYQSKIDSLSL